MSKKKYAPDSIEPTREERVLLERFMGATQLKVLTWNSIMPIVQHIDELSIELEKNIEDLKSLSNWNELLFKKSYVGRGLIKGDMQRTYNQIILFIKYFYENFSKP